MAGTRSKSKPSASARRKSARQEAPIKQPALTRGPQRCRQCPDRPLRTQCSHSAKGRAQAREREASDVLNSSDSDRDPNLEVDNPFIFPASRGTTTPSRPTRSPATLSYVSGPNSVLGSASVSGSLTSGSPSALGLAPGSPLPVLPAPVTPVAPMPVFVAPTAPAGPNIDPALLTPENGGHVPVAAPLESPPAPSSPDEARGQGKTRVRANARRPIYGHVKGVYRGNDQVHNIYRKKARPSVIADTKLASKYFLEHVNSLVEKCEDISIRTGAWLFMGVQHPSASGLPINYASPRLRRDGGADTNKLATSFCDLAGAVMTAKRTDSRQIQLELTEEKKKTALLESELSEAKRRLEAFRQVLEPNAPSQ